MSINFADRFKETSLGQKIILIAGPLLLIDMFLPWYSVDTPIGDFTRNGLQSPGAIWSILAMLIGLIMAGQIAVARFSTMEMPALPEGASWARIHLGLGIAAALLVVIKLISESSYLGFGFYIGILLVAALVAGGFLMFQEEQRGGAGAA